MKNIILTGASIIALSIAAPALAQSNVSTVTQSGNSQDATVTQSGANDESVITQSNADNTATVNQDGIFGSDSFITQSGSENTASVTQTDDGTPQGFGGTVPPSAVSTINQSGNSNSATIAQNTQTQFRPNTSDVNQSGSDNNAIVTQFDDEQSSSINQSSNGNLATVLQGQSQLGTDLTYDNDSVINQAGGDFNLAGVIQTGRENGSDVNQLGADRQHACSRAALVRPRPSASRRPTPAGSSTFRRSAWSARASL